jgi:hypothetical protein
MGRAYSTQEKEVHLACWQENQKEIDHYEDLDIKGRIILKIYLKKLALACGDSIDLSQEGSQWRALEDLVMNLRGSIQ